MWGSDVWFALGVSEEIILCRIMTRLCKPEPWAIERGWFVFSSTSSAFHWTFVLSTLVSIVEFAILVVSIQECNGLSFLYRKVSSQSV